MAEPTKSVVVTGGNTGLGLECVKELAKTKEWHITIASRDVTKSEAAAEAVKSETGWDELDAMALDLGSSESVRKFAAEYVKKQTPPLKAIVCNAGLSPGKNSKNSEGIDTVFAVNHLGHYLLVLLLSKHLAYPARVAIVSSGVHLPDHKLARTMQVPKPKFYTAKELAYADEASKEAFVSTPPGRYANSKLCNVLFGYELSRQMKAQGKDVGVFSIDPGLMWDTELTRDFPPWLVKGIFKPILTLINPLVKGIRSCSVSGKHLARLVTEPTLDGKTELYFDGDEEIKSSPDSYDLDKAKDLWKTSAELCKLKPEETIFSV